MQDTVNQVYVNRKKNVTNARYEYTCSYDRLYTLPSSLFYVHLHDFMCSCKFDNETETETKQQQESSKEIDGLKKGMKALPLMHDT